jgi:periplasmic protein CpxP/Spy
MKKLVVMFSLGMLVAGSSFGQVAPKQDRKVRQERSGQEMTRREGKTPEERAAKRVEMLTKKYNLTQDQQARLQAVHLKHENEMAAMHAQRGTEVSQQQKEAMRAKHAQWDSELQSIFTKEQYAQYQADKKAKGGEMKHKEGKKVHKGPKGQNGQHQKASMQSKEVKS